MARILNLQFAAAMSSSLETLVLEKLGLPGSFVNS